MCLTTDCITDTVCDPQHERWERLLRGALSTANLKCQTNCFCPLRPSGFKSHSLRLLMRHVNVRLCGRRCRASAGCPWSTVLLLCRPVGCGPPAKSLPPPARGSSRWAANATRRQRRESNSTFFLQTSIFTAFLTCFVKILWERPT